MQKNECLFPHCSGRKSCALIDKLLSSRSIGSDHTSVALPTSYEPGKCDLLIKKGDAYLERGIVFDPITGEGKPLYQVDKRYDR